MAISDALRGIGFVLILNRGTRAALDCIAACHSCATMIEECPCEVAVAYRFLRVELR